MAKKDVVVEDSGNTQAEPARKPRSPAQPKKVYVIYKEAVDENGVNHTTILDVTRKAEDIVNAMTNGEAGIKVSTFEKVL